MDQSEFYYSIYQRKIDMLEEYGVTIVKLHSSDVFYIDGQIYYVEDIEDVTEFLDDK